VPLVSGDREARCIVDNWCEKALREQSVPVVETWRDAMKIIVPIKRALDSNVKVRVKADGSGVELGNAR